MKWSMTTLKAANDAHPPPMNASRSIPVNYQRAPPHRKPLQLNMNIAKAFCSHKPGRPALRASSPPVKQPAIALNTCYKN